MEACKACAVQSKGFMITLPDAATYQQVKASVQFATHEMVHEASKCTLYLDERTFYTHLDYWITHLRPETWSVHLAKMSVDGTYQQGHLLDIPELLASRPKVWILDLIKSRRMKMFAQPIVNLADKGSIVGYEMLARGMDEGGQIIRPDVMFEEAKAQGLLFQLDKTCRMEAIRQGAAFVQQQMLFVNFVPTSIYVAEHCLQTTLAIANELQLSPSQVVFEVVETERVEDLEHLKRILRYYRERGFRYALDDVGQGFNDLDTLRSLEPDVVKLDMFYARDIVHSEDKQSVAKQVYDLAVSVGAVPLAEGIENEEDAKMLAQIGYQWQQGFLYGKPMDMNQSLAIPG